MVETVPGFRDGSRVGQHADGAVDRGQLATGNTHGLLVVDAKLETSRAPFDQVEGGLGLEGGNGRRAVTGDDVSAVQQGNSHVLSIARVTDNHLVVRLEACKRGKSDTCSTQTGYAECGIHTLEGQVVHLEALVGALVAGDNRSVGDQRVMDTRVRDQVGLELVQVDVQGTVKAQTGGDGADNLSDQAVQVLIAGTRDIQVAAADVVDSLVVDQESTVGVFDSAVSGQDRVVGLDNGRGHLRGRVHRELELALLAIIRSKTLQEERAETGTSTTTKGVEDQEALKGGAVVCASQSRIDKLLRLIDIPATRRMRSTTLSTSSFPIV